MRVGKRGTACAAVFATIGLTSIPTVAAAAPIEAAQQAGCQTQAQEVAAPPRLMPYAQTRFDIDRIHGFADGRGIRIAVMDSGVDATHRQLRGKVAAGRDFLYRNSDGRSDRCGHGTGVASLIAAQPLDNAQKPLRGLAPAATIVPVRVSEQEAIGTKASESVSAKEFATAIDWAAGTSSGEGNATVINVSATMRDDVPEVREAVRRAIAGGVVVVAAVGNDAEKGNPTPYPAAYPGVIGVGAIGEDGMRQSFSQHGEYVDVVAPGAKLLVANAHHGYQLVDGTSFAAPFVSATAALIQQRFPNLTPAQVRRRIEETADPAPGGPASESYGHGALNPYRALAEVIAPTIAPPRPQTVLPAADPALAAAERRERQAWSTAFVIAAVGLTVTFVVITAAVVIPRGWRRGWRPAGS